ncbi:MAG: general secretion pathway protein GspK [bacterium]|nr:general secretion pathway protein GspK [bacterium]
MKDKNMLSINHQPSTINNQTGIALIIVLSFVLLLGIITSTIVTISQLSARKMAINSEREYSAYIAEGAAARLQWLIMLNKKLQGQNKNGSGLNKNNNRNNVNPAPSKFSATGKFHDIKYYNDNVKYAILDMASGFNISGFNPAGRLKKLLKSNAFTGEEKKAFQIFLNRLTDYVDRNSGANTNGMENVDYANLGLAPLPRNGQIQYRDEVAWIPGVGKLFHPDKFGMFSAFDIIPPKGIYWRSKSVSFFSANKFTLIGKGNFTSEEADYIIRSRNAWLKSGSESLLSFISPEMIKRIKKNFSLRDSDYFTLIIQASPGKGFGIRTLIVSLKIGNSMMNTGNQYFQYSLY